MSDTLRAALEKLADIKHFAAEATGFATASPRTIENCNTIIELADEIRAALAAPVQAQPVAFYVYEWANPSNGTVFRSLRASEYQMGRPPDRVISVPQALPAVPRGWALETGTGHASNTRYASIRHQESQCGQDFYEDRDPLIFAFLMALASRPQAEQAPTQERTR